MIGKLFTIYGDGLSPDWSGFNKQFLKLEDYKTLWRLKTFKAFVNHLNTTFYAGTLDKIEKPTASIVNKRLWQKLADEFLKVRSNAVNPLLKFLDYITYSYMIDNIIFVITGTLEGKDVNVLLDECNPLGYFTGIENVHVTETPTELYNFILFDLPINSFFKRCQNGEKWDHTVIEFVKNSATKEYLDSFYIFCKTLRGKTAYIMCNIISFLADKQVVMVTNSSLNSLLENNQRFHLLPKCARLHPYKLAALAQVLYSDEVTVILSDNYPPFTQILSHGSCGSNPEPLDDTFIKYETKLNINSLYETDHLGVAYSYLKLRELECSNLVKIADCIINK